MIIKTDKLQRGRGDGSQRQTKDMKGEKSRRGRGRAEMERTENGKRQDGGDVKLSSV